MATVETESGLNIRALAEDIGKVAVGFLAFAYVCGFLVLYTFFCRMGIHDVDTELLRIRYVHTELLCLAFPLFLLVPVSAHLWMYLRQRREILSSDVRFGRSRLSYNVQLICVGTCLYTFLLFEPYGAFHEKLTPITLLLAVAILPGVVFRDYLGFAAKEEHSLLRWTVTLVTIILLVWALWERTAPLWSAIIKGTSYWTLMGILLLYSFYALLSPRLTPLFPGQTQGVFIARAATVTTLTLFSTLAFAYRLFPLIPADKGGGNFSYRNDSRVCITSAGLTKPVPDATVKTAKDTVTKTAPDTPVKDTPAKTTPEKPALPEALVDLKSTQGCSVAVKVIESTESTLYVARSDDRGTAFDGRSAPEEDCRSAPEIWTDGEFVPKIYALAKSKVSFVEINFQQPTR